MKNILSLFIIAVIVIGIGANVRGTIAEPATSTTAVVATTGIAASNAAATSALGSAVVIQQLTMCVIPLALLVVLGLAIVAFIQWRKSEMQRVEDVPVTTAPARQVETPDHHTITNQVRTVRRVARVRKPRTASRAAMRMFGK